MIGSIEELVDDRDIIVVCGPGGVGKTTISAALGVAAARAGRSVVVVTVDPARRLADALGISDVGNTPVEIAAPDDDPWPGRLTAVMLDAAATFDDLVRSQAPSASQAEAILNNPLYRNISTALSGTHEYMAIEKLYALATEDAVDLVIVDTPPSRNALDLLDAPRRLVRFIDHPLYRLFTAPSRSLAKAFGVAARTFLWTVKRVAGGQVVEDAIEFLKAFEGMDEGFRRRAAAVGELLVAPTTAFAVVSSPRSEALAEAWMLGSALREGGMGVDALIINQVHPDPGDVADHISAPAGSDLARLIDDHRDLAALAASERIVAVELLDDVGAIALGWVERLDDDVADIAGLDEVAARLIEEPPDVVHTR